VIAFLSFWAIEEYLNNAYFQTYVNQFTNSNGLTIAVAIAVAVSGCVAALVRSRFIRRS
jgi:hypothetical protein